MPVTDLIPDATSCGVLLLWSALPGELRSVRLLDNDKFGPGNRPYWEMKEGRAQFRYPDLIKALRSESDPGRRRQILAGYKTRIFGSSRGTVRAQGASQ